MTTCLGKSCSFGLLRVSFVNVYECVCVILSCFVSRVGRGISLFFPDHCLSVYFVKTLNNNLTV